jgi:hydroxyacylglutathione hydrolase
MINYCYLVCNPLSKRAVLIDPAWQMEKIEDALERTHTKLSGVLLTRAHLDHVHLAEPLANKYECPILMSHEEIASSGYTAKRLIGISMTPWSVGGMLI